MSWQIGEIVQTQKGDAKIIAYKGHNAVFELPDGEIFSFGDVETKTLTPAQTRRIEAKKLIKAQKAIDDAPEEPKESDFDNIIAEAQAKKAALAALKK